MRGESILTGWLFLMVNAEVRNIVKRIDRRKLTNNTQRVLLALLTSQTEWVARTSIRVPSVSARLRDLRKEEFGGFDVECATPNQLARRSRANTTRQTFYRLNPRSVTVSKVLAVFEGVV